MLGLGGLSLIFTKDLIPFSGSARHNGRIRFDVFQQGTVLIKWHPSKWEKDKINPVEIHILNYFVGCIQWKTSAILK